MALKTTISIDERTGNRVEVNGEFASVVEFFQEYASDVSLTGAFFRTLMPAPKGTILALKFTIIDEELEIIEGDGEVVRTIYPEPGTEGEAGMGVRFTRLTDASRAVLERVVAARRDG